MDSIEEAKMRMKARRKGNARMKLDGKSRVYVNVLITRVLVAVIIFFALVISINTTEWGHDFVFEKVFKENISFSGVANIYNKYFGNIVPFDDIIKDDQTVFSEELQYEEISNYRDGYELKVKKNYLVPVVEAGLVVFIGEKEDYGNTIIIQGIDEVDYWYSNVTNTPVSLYDYVSKGNYLGTANGEHMYMTFKKGNEYLEYDEVVN